MSYIFNKKNLVALLFIGIGFFLLQSSTGDQGILYKAVTDEIDPMDFPKLLLKFWIGFSVLYLLFPTKPLHIQNLRAKVAPLLLTVLCLAAYIFAFPYVGLFTSSFIFLCCFFFIHKYKGVLKSIMIAAVTALLTWTIFTKILSSPMPTDILLGG